MKRLLRPSLLLVVLAALVLGAALVFFQSRPSLGPPQPLPVAPGDQEVVWLYPATNAANWERFVAALRLAAERLQADFPGVTAQDGGAFPPQTTAVPEIALAFPGRGRLVFRWYKLTSDWKTHDWVEALLARRPPPLAVVGGSSSDGARDLAIELDRSAAALPAPARPLLLLTQATADRVPAAGDGSTDEPAEMEETPGVPLNGLYRGRTFRFCFTNRQMARAVCSFLWSRDDLRPDADPVHMVQWEDDAYSLDLAAGFRKELRRAVAPAVVQDWAWLRNSLVVGGSPPGLGGGVFPWVRAGAGGSSFRMTRLPNPQRIDFSVGSFASPNRPEAQAARFLVEDMRSLEKREGLPQPQRPLLVVTGQTAPTRRFLRALARTDPGRRFVAVTGDALAFNTVYRDRRAAWPIQDLPFALVFFCHRDPIDAEAGFRPPPTGKEEEDLGDTARTGTEDVLLYDDIIEALAQAAPRPAGPADADRLAERLAALRVRDGRLGLGAEGRPLFDAQGDRNGGEGEHVVCLRPLFRDERVLPEAILEVWEWRGGATGAPDWRRRGEPLRVTYDDTP
jgi:hypothetical protein